MNKAQKERNKKKKIKILDEYTIDQALARFAIDEPFYGHISANIEKYKTDKLDTAGVTVKDGKLILLYNEDFFNSLSWKHKKGLLIHEFLHIVFNHATSRVKKDKNGGMDNAWLYATDFSINSMIPEPLLPEGGLIPGRWKELSREKKARMTEKSIANYEIIKKMIRSWQKGMSADWYYNEICKNRKAFDDLLKNDILQLHDDHSGWDEMSDEEKQILEEDLKNLVNDAKDSADKNATWGSVPIHLKSLIRSYCEPKLYWPDILRNFVGRSRQTHKKTSLKKINKRYPYIHPGQQRKTTARVAICIDQSASVDDESLGRFFDELNALADYTKFTVVPFDTKVVENGVFEWKKGIVPERVAQGGTNFDVPTRWINENHSKFDAVLFMTDGFCDKPITCRIPRAWIISSNGKLLFETHELVINMNS